MTPKAASHSAREESIQNKTRDEQAENGPRSLWRTSEDQEDQNQSNRRKGRGGQEHDGGNKGIWKNILKEVAAGLGVRWRSGQLLFLNNRLDRPHAGQDPVAVFPILEERRKLFPDDLAGKAIRQSAFQSIADFDAHLSVVRRDQNQDAVILPFFANAPFLEKLDRDAFDAIAIQRRQRDDSQFMRRGLFKGLQVGFEGLAGGVVQEIGVVADVSRRTRNLGGRRAGGRQDQTGESAPY